MDVKTAIQTGDAVTLRRLLAERHANADELVRWGPNCNITTHPLHFVSDMLFNGALRAGQELPLINALIEAGANVDFQKPARVSPRDGYGETPLIGAASLGAEEVGLRLVDAGARPELRGIIGETALHWAAIMGADRLVHRLIQRGAPLEVRDEKYQATPLGWAVHGGTDAPAGAKRGRHCEVVLLLVAAGATVEAAWLKDEKVRADTAMLAALGGGMVR